MKVAHPALCLLVANRLSWYAEWAAGLPLIVLTLVIRVFGLLLVKQKVDQVQNRIVECHSFPLVFVVTIGLAALLATVLHGIEGMIWAAAYLLLGALPDYSSAILYSLNAMTSYGHENLVLEKHWQLMGALEALNGMLLFGLTTAFLFGIIQRVRGLQSSGLR